MAEIEADYFIGCDVGTQSVKVCVLDNKGQMVVTKTHPIKTWRPLIK